MKIKGYHVPVDIEGELRAFDWGHNARFYPGKIHACSPFRDEETPSFVVFLDRGNWTDRGFAREGYEKGDFITLLAYLRGTDRENTERYLLRKYLAIDVEGLSLSLRLTLEPPAYPVMDKAALDNLSVCDYLVGRGIDAQTQARYHAGYHAFMRAAVLPWFDIKGNLINIKYRATTRKYFWCPEGGQMLSNHLFGWEQAKDADTLYITEAEIDALYLAANGYAAVALGTASMSPIQEKLLILHPARHIIIATDNDPAGHKAAWKIAKRLGGFKDVSRFVFPQNCNDVNDVKPLRVDCRRSGFLTGVAI